MGFRRAMHGLGSMIAVVFFSSFVCDETNFRVVLYLICEFVITNTLLNLKDTCHRVITTS